MNIRKYMCLLGDEASPLRHGCYEQQLMTKRGRFVSQGLLVVLLLTAACSRKVVMPVEERLVVVHDTVCVVPPRVWAHPLDSVAEDALMHFTQFTARTTIGLCVADLDTGDTLAWIDGNKRMRTASVMKAVTAITALATVADTATAFTTSVLTDGKRLWIRGGYDPLISKQEVEGLARDARRRAPQFLDKNVSLPARLTCDMEGQDTKKYGRGWCWDDKNPLLTPLFYGPMTQLRKRQPIDRPEQDFMDAFNAAWKRAKAGDAASSLRRGGDVQQSMTKRDASSPNEATNEATSESPNEFPLVVASFSRPIGEVLRPMLKESDNLMAEAVWRLTGNTTDERAEALAAVARQAGVTGSEYEQADGSGLSLYDYFTPSALVKLLSWADAQPFAPALRSALPLMGVDGTLKNRRVRGARIEAKTGTVEGVITLAGYMTLISGRRLVFAVMMNGVPSKGDARAVTDYLLEKLAE